MKNAGWDLMIRTILNRMEASGAGASRPACYLAMALDCVGDASPPGIDQNLERPGWRGSPEDGSGPRRVRRP